EYQVEPAAELVADLAEAGHALEAEAFVKPDRRVVRRVDAADHHVLSQRERGGKKRLDEDAPDAARAHVATHADGMIPRVAISRPRAAPFAERGKAENAAVDRDEHRKALGPARGPPRVPLLDGRGRRRVDRGRSGDHVVVDRQDAREIGLARRAYYRHRLDPA